MTPEFRISSPVSIGLPAPTGTQASDASFQILASSPQDCRQRYDDWEGGLKVFLSGYDSLNQGLQDDLANIRGGGIPPSIKLDAITSALGKVGPMRQGAEGQIEAIDELLRDCGPELTAAQKARISEVKGRLSGDLNSLRGLEFLLPSARFGIQSGQAVDGALANIGRLLDGIGSWVPPIPIPLPVFKNP